MVDKAIETLIYSLDAQEILCLQFKITKGRSVMLIDHKEENTKFQRNEL